MLPKELYVVVDCEKIEPGKYQIFLHKKYVSPIKSSECVPSHYRRVWTPYEGEMTIQIVKCDGRMLEVLADWVDSPYHLTPCTEHPIEYDKQSFGHIWRGEFYLYQMEAMILSVGSIISGAVQRSLTTRLLHNVACSEYNEDIKRIMKKFKVTDYELPG